MGWLQSRKFGERGESVRRRAITAAGMLALFSAATIRADSIVAVAGRAALGGNDFVDWGVLGPDGTIVSNPFAISSHAGLGLTVSQTAAKPFERVEQAVSWPGNFAPSDAALWDAQRGNQDSIGHQMAHVAERRPISMATYSRPSIAR